MIVLLLASTVHGQPLKNVTDFEDLDKTMAAFELAFQEGDQELFAKISADAFQKSAYYKRLRGQLGTLKVNSGVASQMAEQTFMIDPGNREVSVRFDLRDDRWVVSGTSRDDAIRSFPMLAREYRFSDFRRAVEGNELSRLAGIAPYGQLPTSVFKDKKLEPRAETTVTVMNLLLHDGSKVTDVFYVRARKSTVTDGGSRGWLLYEAGPMLKLLRAQAEQRPLLDFLSQNQEAFDLKKKSSFLFSNAAPADDAPSLPVTHVDYRVTKVSATSFKWDGQKVRFLLVVDCDGASWSPDLKVTLDQRRLILDTQSDVRFVGTPAEHRYLKTQFTGGRLIITVDEEVPKRPIDTFAGAVVRDKKVVPATGGLRITLEIEGKRLPG
jgi:hypothetical protein